MGRSGPSQGKKSTSGRQFSSVHCVYGEGKRRAGNVPGPRREAGSASRPPRGTFLVEKRLGRMVRSEGRDCTGRISALGCPARIRGRDGRETGGHFPAARNRQAQERQDGDSL